MVLNDILRLDGSYMEGGGQIVRTALALSVFSQKQFSVDKIRQGRPEPGLKAQHVNCITALQQLCSAEAEGAALGSSFVTFKPKQISASKINIDIGTAGSVTLLLQSVLLPCVFHDKKTSVKIKGGTDVVWSPTFDYFKEIILPQLNRYAEIHCDLLRRGFYPKGSGFVELRIKPYKLEYRPSIEMLQQGELLQIKGRSFASKDLEKASVAERQARAAKLFLKQYYSDVKIDMEYNETYSSGSGITLWAIFRLNGRDVQIYPVRLGADALGRKGKRAEIVGEEAAKQLHKSILSGAPVDAHLSDNLVPFLGVVGGAIKVSEISRHTLTNIYVTEKFLNKKFAVDKKNNIISV